MLTIQSSQRQNEEITMLDRPTQSKRLLSHMIAEGAYSRRYEHFSPEAIQATKLLSFDSTGCALGGSQQDDAKILLAPYRAAGGDNGAAAAFAGPVFVATGHGDVLAQLRAATESNILNLRLR
jgi:hypothetical protein